MAWFRFYDEVVDDHKVQQLTPLMFKTWVNCMCIAKQYDGILPPIETIAYKLRVTIPRAKAFLEALCTEKLIDIRNDGDLEMHNWQGRQFKSDSSTERVTRWRERQRNVTETLPETDQSRAEQRHIQNRTEKKASAAVEDLRRAPLKEFFFTEFKKRRESDLFTDPSDWKAFENLLRATRIAPAMSVEEICKRWIRFLESEQEFHRRQGHPLRWFCSNINAFSGNGSTSKKQASIDWESPEMKAAEKRHREIYGDRLK